MLKLCKDKNGLVSICNDMPRRNMIFNEWNIYDGIPFTVNEKIINSDGSYYYNCRRLYTHIDISWDDEPVDVTLTPVDTSLTDSDMWLCRNKNGNLVLCLQKPERNLVNPWWSSASKLEIIDIPSFSYLTWESEPIKVIFLEC